MLLLGKERRAQIHGPLPDLLQSLQVSHDLLHLMMQKQVIVGEQVGLSPSPSRDPGQGPHLVEDEVEVH